MDRDSPRGRVIVRHLATLWAVLEGSPPKQYPRGHQIAGQGPPIVERSTSGVGVVAELGLDPALRHLVPQLQSYLLELKVPSGLREKVRSRLGGSSPAEAFSNRGATVFGGMVQSAGPVGSCGIQAFALTLGYESKRIDKDETGSAGQRVSAATALTVLGIGAPTRRRKACPTA